MYGIINIVLVGLLVFYLLRRNAKRRPIGANTAPELPLSTPPAIVPRDDLPAAAPKPSRVAPVQPSVPVRTRPGPRYLLGEAHGTGKRDRVQAMLDTMSGPGICTPRHR